MFNTSEAKSVYNNVRPLIVKALQEIDKKQFHEIDQALSEAGAILAASQSACGDDLYLVSIHQTIFYRGRNRIGS